MQNFMETMVEHIIIDISEERVNRYAIALTRMTFPYNTHGMPQSASDLLRALRNRINELENNTIT